MKRIVMTSALVATATAAVAADLPSRKAAPAYEPMPPVLTWAGPSLGIQLGGVFGSGSTNVSSWGSGGGCQVVKPTITDIFTKTIKPPKPDDEIKVINPCYPTNSASLKPATPLPAYLTPFPTGGAAAAATNGNIGGSGGAFIGGGAANYRWQFGSFVAGLEFGMNGLAGGGANGTITGVSSDGIYSYLATTHVSRKLNWLGTFNGQVGYAVMPQLLIFAHGGLAFGGVSSNASIVGSATPAVGNWVGGSWFGNQSMNSTRVGYNVGGGVEYMFNPAWSARLSYTYYDLGSANYDVAWGGAGMTGATRIHNRFNGNIVQAGIFWHWR